jgi:hypothetical protein
MAHKKKIRGGKKTSERKTAKKGKSRKHHEPKKQTTKTKRSVAKVGTGKLRSGKKQGDSGGHRSAKAAPYRYIPEFMRARSEASKAAWRVRWDRGTAPIGRVGADYIQSTYGPVISSGDFGPFGAGGSGGPSPGSSSGGGRSSGPSVVPAGKPRTASSDHYQNEEMDDFEDHYDDYDFYDREY